MVRFQTNSDFQDSFGCTQHLYLSLLASFLIWQMSLGCSEDTQDEYDNSQVVDSSIKTTTDSDTDISMEDTSPPEQIEPIVDAESMSDMESGMDGSTVSTEQPGSGIGIPSSDAWDSSIVEQEDAVIDSSAAHPDAGEMTDAGIPPCPEGLTLPSRDYEGSLQHEGRNRTYIVHVPGSYTGQMAVPLVLDFHGHGSNAGQEAGGSGWWAKADQEGFIIVYPEGVDGSWNVGNCCGTAVTQNIDDVGFVRALVSKLSTETCIDPKKVYATGISNGAGFSHRLACEAADIFAATSAASADLVTDPCIPSRPISQLSVRGTGDFLVAYAGGWVGSGWYSPGAIGSFELWKEIDHCTGTSRTDHQYCETYSECADGVEVTLCTLPGAGHILYTNNLGFDFAAVSWEMFQRQPME